MAKKKDIDKKETTDSIKDESKKKRKQSPETTKRIYSNQDTIPNDIVESNSFKSRKSSEDSKNTESNVELKLIVVEEKNPQLEENTVSDALPQSNDIQSENKIIHIPKINLFLPKDGQDEVSPFIEDVPETEKNKPITWVQYTSEKINRTYFVPLFGVAHRFYPRLYYCENRVKLISYINGKEVIYEENSISDKRTDFDFLPVLLQWRIQYMKSSLNFKENQVDAWIELENDIITLHNLIRIKYFDIKIKDLIQFTNASNALVNSHLSEHKEFVFTDVHGYTEVEINKLFIKYNIEFKFKNTEKIFHKHINVILE